MTKQKKRGEKSEQLCKAASKLVGNCAHFSSSSASFKVFRSLQVSSQSSFTLSAFNHSNRTRAKEKKRQPNIIEATNNFIYILYTETNAALNKFCELIFCAKMRKREQFAQNLMTDLALVCQLQYLIPTILITNVFS